jgi:5-methyltetrahydropteroyltriglutamate--homocysteine methyltransferase
MYRATDGILLPTTITGSLPRPRWYTESLGSRSFLEAMASADFREQYMDAVSTYLRDQENAGLDICTDGDCRFDNDVGGQSWAGYVTHHLSGYDLTNPNSPGRRAAFPPGSILADNAQTRVLPRIVGPIGRGELQYANLWKAAQRQTSRPVKFGTAAAEVVAMAADDRHYKSLNDRMFAIAAALHAELAELAELGCAAVQIEEPQIHMLAAHAPKDRAFSIETAIELFNETVKGLRGKTEIWAHTCWGNPSQQRMYAAVQSYAPGLAMLNRLDCDIITFESVSSGGIDLEAIGREIAADRKIGIGVIDHHTLQVERPEEVAAHIRTALKYIPVERLVISTDCGMGREGMSRRHAFFKMAALVQGTNIVRRELGLVEAHCRAADERYAFNAPAH